MNKQLAIIPLCLLTFSCTQSQSKPELSVRVSTSPQVQNLSYKANLTARKNYTGVVKTVDDIAQQITVRIEDKNGGNGSGVIVAREGNTYYVATAAHVIQEPRDDRQKIAIALVTPTQERIMLSQSDLTVVNKGLDIGVVKFKSTQNYQIAKIGKYEFNQIDWVFVSGFPGQDRSKQRHLTIGSVQDRLNTEFRIKNRASLSEGRNLIYTNLSLPGMSGGAVLDRQGRLVGINTGAENEGIIPNGEYQQINFGFALGIPMATVMGVTSQGQIPTARLQVSNTPIPKSSQSEVVEIQRIQLSTLVKPSLTAKAKEWLDYGNLLWRGDKQIEAVTAFETAIKLLAREPEISVRQDQLKIAYFGLGLAWWTGDRGLTTQNLQSAVVAFQQAVKVDPNFSLSSRYLGNSLFKLKRYDEALMAFRQAISSGKGDFVLYQELGNVLREMKRYPEAVDAYNQAVKLQPNHPWGYNNRGNIYTSLKQYPQAIADFKQAIELDPQDPKAYNNRGLVHDALKQYPQELADFNQAIKLDPNYSTVYYNRGTFYNEQKQYPQAIADFNQAIELAPNYAKAYHNRGVVYGALKQYPQTIADFNQAIELDPNYVDAYISRGIVYSDLKQYSQAIADFNQAIKLDPNSATAYIGRGFSYDLLQQYSQAIADYSQGIKLDPFSILAYGNRGNAYKVLEQYPQAIADYTQVIKLDPNSADIYISRGITFAMQKRYPQAKADLQKAAELFRAQNNTAAYQQVMNILQQFP
jgi:tetratricopeptide (TPR) repeat protein/S1-C subfamily serine protease